jgi:Flp pilus assembly protein TadD
MPSSSIFPAADLGADRRLYLPLVAFAALAGLLLQSVGRRVFVVALALVLAAISFTRTKVWLTEHALWTEAVERAPRKLRALLQLSRASDAESALRILDYAQTIAPNDSRPPLEEGLRLLAMNSPERALAQFDRALVLLPNDPEILNNRGVALTFLGRPDSAAEAFRRSLSINPCMAIARRNLERLGLTNPISCH